TTYEQVKRGECGPHTLAVADILQRWAQMWAADMRESAARRAEGFDLDIDADAQWLANMANADAEIDRYLAANRLGRAA
ncbi:MAG TPA: hypothetical protein VFS52_20720, partial [Steroidobacteraceae bacterium]|nr:hypothetical protein [Steroidobacteraceae bacterium]